MSFKDRIKKIIGEGYKSSEERNRDRFLMGECLLEMKRNLWDSEKVPFSPENWDEYGFQVFSQSNEDGLIQYLIHCMEIPNKTFIEFGVEDYTECNTKFLLMNNNWSGLVMDGSPQNMGRLRNSALYWRHDLEAIDAFITKDNINGLIKSRGFDEEVGILSIDIDGNDYWVWEAIDCISPCIVICEYNPIYGADSKVTIPYKPDFYRTDAHYSNLYWGASLGAYAELGRKKGYKLVCTNRMRHNAFFVRKDIKCDLPEVSVAQAWREAKYRESRDEAGNLSFLSREDGLKLIQDEMVVDVVDGKMKRIKSCC